MWDLEGVKVSKGEGSAFRRIRILNRNTKTLSIFEFRFTVRRDYSTPQRDRMRSQSSIKSTGRGLFEVTTKFFLFV
jgi:hypothetical protein